MFSSNYFMSYKNRGASKQLTGDVIVIVFYVNDASSKWTEQAKTAYMKAHNTAMNRVMNDAKKKNVFLNIRTASCELDVTYDCNNSNCYQWISDAISVYRKKSINEYQDYYENKYECDEAPVIFAHNRRARSFASVASRFNPHLDESSIVFKETSTTFSDFTIEHELMHQFGAMDFYYPNDVKAYAQKYLPGSIMNDGYKIDPLTEYLIGWTASIDNNAYNFLSATNHYTKEQIYDAMRKEWKRDW